MPAFWRDPVGFTIGNESKAAPVAPPDMARFRYTGTKIQISLSGQPYKDLAITAADIPLDGVFPDGISTELQARGSATTLKRVTYSGTAGANVTLGGTLTIDAATSPDRTILLSSVFSAPQTTMILTQYQSVVAPILLQFDRARGTSGAGAQNLIDNDPVGEIRFRGQVSGAFANLGYMRTSWNLNDGGYVEVGTGTAPAKDGPGARLIITQNIGSGFFTNTGAVPFIVDNAANVRVGLGSLPTTATAGFLWVPQATGLMTAAPSPVHPGWKPLAFIGSNLYTHDGSTWTQISGSSNQMSTWLWSSSLSGAVAAGVVAIDNNDPSLATAVRIAEASDTSTDVSAILQALIPGDGIYIQNTADNTKWVRYTIAGPLVDEGTWRTVPVDVADYGGTDLNDAQVNITFVRGGGGGGGGANPEGVASEIQYRKTATEFGAVVNSSVMGADAKFGGSLTVSNATPTVAASKGFFINPTVTNLSVLLGQTADTPDPILIDIQRSGGVGGAPTNTAKGQYIGRLLFSRYFDATFPTVGYLHAVWDGDGTTDLGGAVALGAGATVAGGPQVAIQYKNAGSSSVTTYANNATWLQVSADGFRFSHGTTGSIFYRDQNSYFVSLDIDANPEGGTDLGKVLTVTDVGSGVLLPRWQAAGAATVRLDQVLNPDMPPPVLPETQRVKNFLMTDHSLVFTYTATQAEECFVIVSTEPVTPGAAGSLLLLQAQGATTEKNPLRIEARNAFVMSVTSDGKVAIGSETITSAHKVGILNANSTIGSLVLQDSIPVAGGARNAFTMSLTDNTTTAHSGYYGINITYSKTAVQTSAPAVLLHLNPSSIAESLSALTSINLRGPGVLPGKTLTTWTGINVANVALGGAVTNKYAMIVESGAGSVGLGTSTPVAQLHVVGGVRHDQAVGQWMSLYKYSGTTGESPILIFASARGTGAGSEAPLQAADGAGAILFTGWLSTSYAQYGYVRSFHGGAFGNVVEIGAGDVDQSRVQITQSPTGGSVTLHGGPHWWQIQTAGFATSLGDAGAIFFKVAEDYISALEITGSPAAPVYLRSTGIEPGWSALVADDISGVVPLSKGGTGSSLIDPDGDRLIFWDDDTGAGAGATAWLTLGSNLSITGTTLNAAGGAAYPPQGSTTELQYRKADGTMFQAVTGSSVSGASITLGGDLGFTDSVSHRINFHRSTVPSSGQYVGSIWFKVAGAAPPEDDVAVLRCTATAGGYLTDWGLSATNLMYVGPAATGLQFSPTRYIQLQATGIRISGGLQGAIFYQNTVSSELFYQPLELDPGKFLKAVGTAPMWVALTAGDITTGVLPIARGGTGDGTEPAVGQILRADTTLAYKPATLEGAGSVSVTYNSSLNKILITGTGTAYPPQGDGTELQYRKADGTMFQAVTGSSVSGADIGLAGHITIRESTERALVFHRNTVPSIDGQHYGDVIFRTGAGAGTDIGVLRCFYKTSDLSGNNIGLGLTDTKYVSVSDIATTITFLGKQVQIQTNGIIITGGVNGGVFYQNTSGFHVSTPAGAASEYLKGGTIPTWGGLNAGHVTGGVLPLTYGGTGASLADPGTTDHILFWDDSASGVTWLKIGANLLVDGLTNTLSAVAGAGGYPPGTGTTTTPLQYRMGDTTFGGISGSSVDGYDITLGGKLTFDSGLGTTQIALRRLGGDAIDGTEIGRLTFWGRRAGVTPNVDFGFLRGYWDDTQGPSRVVEIGQSSTVACRSTATASGIIAEPYWVVASTSGIRFSIGLSQGAMFYHSFSSPNYYLTAITPGTTAQFLRGGPAPAWAAIAQTDVTGIVPLNKGGTGAILTDPDADKILFWDDSATSTAWLTLGSNLSIDGLTNTLNAAGATGGTPTGADYQIQYYRGGAFDGINGFEVAGGVEPNIVLAGGYLQLANGPINPTTHIVTRDQEFFISATTAAPTRFVMRCYRGASIPDDPVGTFAPGPYIAFERARGSQATSSVMHGGDIAGLISFSGDIGEGGMTQLGFIHAYWSGASLGPVVRVAGRLGNARLEITDNTPINNLRSVTLRVGTSETDPNPQFFQVLGTGFRISAGNTGAIYYQSRVSSSSVFTALETAGAMENYVLMLKTGNTSATGEQSALVPKWQPGPAPGGSTGTPLQYRAGPTTFGEVVGSSVSGSPLSNITLAGDLTFIRPNATTNILIERSGADILSPQIASLITFRQYRSGPRDAYLRYMWSDTDGGALIDFGLSATQRVGVSDTAVSLIFGTQQVQVKSGGIVIGGSSSGGLFYHSGATGYLTQVPINAPTDTGKWLRNNGVTPQYQSITAGSNIMLVEIGGGIRIDATTGTGSASPVGYTGQIQFNNGGAFGGVGDASGTPGSFEVSPVSGPPNLILAGGFFQIVPSISGTFPSRFVNQDQEFFISATTAAPTRFVMRRYSNNPSDGSGSDGRLGGYIRFDKGRGTAGLPSDVTNGDQIGLISFWGRISGALAQMGFISTYFNSGGVLRLAAKTATYAYIDIREGTVPATDNAVSLYAASETQFVQVQNAGIRMSVGAHGSILWQDSTTGTLLVAGLPISTNNTLVLRTDGAKPYWGAAPGATPGGATYDIQYRTATPSFGGISQVTNGILLCSSGAPPFWTATFGPVRYTFSPTSAVAGLNIGSLSGSNPSSPVNGDIYYNSTAGKIRAYQNGAWIEPGTAAGSSTEVQYRNSSTGVFAAVLNSTVDTSGVVTFGSGRTNWIGDGVIAGLDLTHYSNVASFGNFLTATRSRGSSGSKLALAAGDAIFETSIFGQYDASNRRYCGALSFDALGAFSSTSSPTIFKIKTTQPNSVTPYDRLVLGGTKQLANATLTDLFSVTFGDSVQGALGGEVHMLFVAKGTITGGAHDGVNIFVHRRVISFAIAHNKTNDMQITFTEVQQHRAGGASDDTGLTAISHALNFDGAVSTGTNIPASPNAYATNSITYKILATAVPNMTSVSQLTCYYHIIYHGEAQLTLL